MHPTDSASVARCSNFPEPDKSHRLADATQPDSGLPNSCLKAEYLGVATVRLSASRPTKRVWLDTGVRLDADDIFIDLRPGEGRTVTFTGLHGLPICVRALDTDPMTITLHTGAVRETGAVQETGTAEAQSVGGRA